MSQEMKKPPNRAAKILYQPFGLVSGLIAGLIAGQIFKQIWKRASSGHHEDAPSPLEADYSFKEVVLGALVQGAIFAAVRTVVSRGGARAFERWTGEWPGN